MKILCGLEGTIKRWRPAIYVEIWDDKLGVFLQWCERHRYYIAERFPHWQGIQNYLVKPSVDEPADWRPRAKDANLPYWA